VNKKPKNLIASLQQIDSTFTDLLQEFPADLVASAKEFEAFRRGRKIKSVEQLFQLVLLYCGLDYSLRQTAGTLALLGTRLSDQAVSDRPARVRWVADASVKTNVAGITDGGSRANEREMDFNRRLDH